MNELMILFLENDWLMYGVCGVTVLGSLIPIVLSVIYNRSLNASDRMRSTRMAWLKQMKTRFESGYEWDNRIRNVELFVDKNIGRRKWLGIYLKTWEAIGRMMIFLEVLLAVFGAIIAAMYQKETLNAMIYLMYGGLFAVLLYGITVFANLKDKRELLRTNLCEYFENTLQGEARKRHRSTRNVREEYLGITKPQEEIACTQTEAGGTATEQQIKKRAETKNTKKQQRITEKNAKKENRTRQKLERKAAKDAGKFSRKQKKEQKRVAKLTKRMEKMQQRMGLAATSEHRIAMSAENAKEESARQKREQLKRKVDVTPAQEDQIISEVLKEFLV